MIPDQQPAFVRSRRIVLAAALALVSACAARQPSPEDLAAKRFEAVPGKAVIYVVRDRLDFTDEQASITLDGSLMGTTYRGTYFRWVVEPGRHRIAGFAGDAGWFALDAAAGRIYYVEQTTLRRLGWVQSHFQLLPENAGRAAVQRAELIAFWKARS